MDNRENILRLNRDRDPSFSDPPQRDVYRGNFQQQKRPWKPHGGYKRLNEMNPQKYASRPYYSENTGDAGGDYPEENFFKDYKYQNDRYNYSGGGGSYGYGGYSGKGSEFNNYSSPNTSTTGITTGGYTKGNTGGYQGAGGQVGTYNTEGNVTYNYQEYNQNVKSTSYHGLRTNSNEFYAGQPEIKDFSEQFVIKKTGTKSPEKKKKPRKPINEDRVSSDFFDNKGMIPTQRKNAEESEDEQKEGTN